MIVNSYITDKLRLEIIEWQSDRKQGLALWVLWKYDKEYRPDWSTLKWAGNNSQSWKSDSLLSYSMVILETLENYYSTCIHINQFHLHFNMQVITYYIHEGFHVVIGYCSLFTVDFHKFVVLFIFLESSFPVIVQSSVLISEFPIINTIS